MSQKYRLLFYIALIWGSSISFLYINIYNSVYATESFSICASSAYTSLRGTQEQNKVLAEEFHLRVNREIVSIILQDRVHYKLIESAWFALLPGELPIQYLWLQPDSQNIQVQLFISYDYDQLPQLKVKVSVYQQMDKLPLLDVSEKATMQCIIQKIGSYKIGSYDNVFMAMSRKEQQDAQKLPLGTEQTLKVWENATSLIQTLLLSSIITTPLRCSYKQPVNSAKITNGAKVMKLLQMILTDGHQRYIKQTSKWIVDMIVVLVYQLKSAVDICQKSFKDNPLGISIFDPARSESLCEISRFFIKSIFPTEWFISSASSKDDVHYVYQVLLFPINENISRVTWFFQAAVDTFSGILPSQWGNRPIISSDASFMRRLLKILNRHIPKNPILSTPSIELKWHLKIIKNHMGQSDYQISQELTQQLSPDEIYIDTICNMWEILQLARLRHDVLYMITQKISQDTQYSYENILSSTSAKCTDKTLLLRKTTLRKWFRQLNKELTNNGLGH